MRIWLTGGTGLLGAALISEFRRNYPLYEVLSPSRADLELLDIESVKIFVQENKPTHVIHTAATVMGIAGHQNYPTKSLYENSRIDLNIFEALNSYPPEWIFYASTVAAYGHPYANIPLIENDFLIGEPHESESGYALAKRSGIKFLNSLELNHGTKYCYGILTNMYGLADRDKSGSGHVVAGLIERASRAKIDNLPLQVWGSGQATRDFISAENVSQLIIQLLDKNTHELNIASGIEVSIKDLAANVAAVFNLDKGVVFTGENEGIIRRYSDITKLRKFLPNFNCEGMDSFFKTIAF